MNITARLLSILLLSILVFAQASPAAAQEEGRLILGLPDTSRFPTVRFHLDAYEADGDFLANLGPADVTVIEDGRELRPRVVEKIPTGLQIIFAINTSPALAAQRDGVSEYERINRALQDWAASQPAGTLDDFSLATPTGLFLIRSRDPQALEQALNDFQPDLARLQPSLNSLAEALDLATDPLGRPLMKRSILYITPPLPAAVVSTLPDLALRAQEIDVQVNVWLLDPAAAPEAALTAEDPLQRLALDTGGQFFRIAAEGTLPGIEPLFKPLRQTYRIDYISAVQKSGIHDVSVEVQQRQYTYSSNKTSFELEVQPPNPIFLSPPASIRRSWKLADETTQAILSPEEVSLQILVEFPDQHPRDLQATRLYVNGELVDENTAEPFDQFTWSLEGLDTPQRRLLRVEVVDMLGLSATSMEIPVELLVDQPAATSLIENMSERGLIAVAGMLVSGVVLALVLYFTSRRRRMGRKRQQTDPRKLKDPVTQPVKIQPVPPRQDRSHRSQPRKEREKVTQPASIWPRALSQTAPARLVVLDENEQPITGGAIPLSRQEITLGSDPRRATQVINSPTVDGLHARLYRTEEGFFYLADQNSVAGTWINYAPVTQSGARLEHGDLVHVGKVMFRFELTDPARVSPAEIKVTHLDT